MPTHSERSLLLTVRRALAEQADATTALEQQRYMKSQMPYHGVKLPVVRATVKELFREIAWPDAAAWEKDARVLYFDAEFREERYAAIALLRHTRAKAFRTSAALPLYEAMIVEGAWWDLVDELASHLVGPLLDLSDGASTARSMRAWSKCDDHWKRRTSIICQINRKDRTDTKLLTDCIAPSLGDKDFFLRKGIGWALRSYHATDAAWVRAYVKAHDTKLSGLSKREALKHDMK
jgi:3-methyladenine DNA glycosylase AlkD